jgi:hypothetical protein
MGGLNFDFFSEANRREKEKRNFIFSGYYFGW